jgi:hypothetical protein
MFQAPRASKHLPVHIPVDIALANKQVFGGRRSWPQNVRQSTVSEQPDLVACLHGLGANAQDALSCRVKSPTGHVSNLGPGVGRCCDAAFH